MDTSLNSLGCDQVWNFTTRIYPASGALERLQWSDTEKLLYQVILPIIIVVGVLANLAFVFTIIRVKRMQTSTNYYLANLACADLLYLMILLCTRIHAFRHSPFRENIPYMSRNSCWGSIFPIFLCYFASVELVTLVSLERYYSICKPVYHRLMRGKQPTIRLIILAWILAIVLAAITVPRYGKMRRLCIIWPGSDKFQQLPTTYQTCHTVSFALGLSAEIIQSVIFLAALGISCFTYYKLIRKLSNLKLSGVGHSSKNKRNLKIRNQVARLLIINGVVFFLCQFPARYIGVDRFIRGAYRHLKSQPFVAIVVSFILLLINSAVNPFIYGLSSRLYRVAFCQAFGITRFFNMERLSSHADSFHDATRTFSERESFKRKQGSASTLDNIDNTVIQPTNSVNKADRERWKQKQSSMSSLDNIDNIVKVQSTNGGIEVDEESSKQKQSAV